MIHNTKINNMDMKNLANDIGNLRYDALQELLKNLSDKFYYDSMDDELHGRKQVASYLINLSIVMKGASESALSLWNLCKPFMNTEEIINKDSGQKVKWTTCNNDIDEGFQMKHETYVINYDRENDILGIREKDAVVEFNDDSYTDDITLMYTKNKERLVGLEILDYSKISLDKVVCFYPVFNYKLFDDVDKFYGINRKLSYAEQIDRFKNNPIHQDDVKAMIDDDVDIITEAIEESILDKDWLKDCEDKVWRNL